MTGSGAMPTFLKSRCQYRSWFELCLLIFLAVSYSSLLSSSLSSYRSAVVFVYAFQPPALLGSRPVGVQHHLYQHQHQRSSPRQNHDFSILCTNKWTQQHQQQQPLCVRFSTTSNTLSSPLFASNDLRHKRHYHYNYHQQQKQQELQSQSLSSTRLFMINSMNSNSNKMLASYYEDMIVRKLPSKQFIDTVERLNVQTNGQVIASDVASNVGISLSQARKELTTLASLTSGDIAVNTDGELIYSFPKNNIGQILSNKSLKYKITDVARKVWPRLFWLIRVAFGITLLASLVAIFSAIFFIQTSASSSSSDREDRNERRGGGGFGGMSNSYWGPRPLDFLYYQSDNSNSNSNSNNDKDPDEMGFLESVFSYVFGDGNPNPNLNEKRLQLASNMIRQNNGAVTAEQLAPFCGDDDQDIPTATTATSSSLSSSSTESLYVDESFVLPIVTALNGEPAVTPNGDIVYLFPELQVTSTTDTAPSLFDKNNDVITTQNKAKEASLLERAGLSKNASSREITKFLNYNGISTRGILDRDDLLAVLEDVLPPVGGSRSKSKSSPLSKKDDVDTDYDYNDPSVLLERPWQFTLAPGINKVLAGGLGVVNLGGAAYLGSILGQYVSMYNAARVAVPPTVVAAATAYPLLLSYAILFNVIPLIRNIWIQNENNKIKKRNERRLSWRDRIRSIAKDSSSGLYKKLQSAKKMQTKVKQLSSSNDNNTILYDTRQSIESVSYEKEKNILSEFDRVLGTNTNNNNKNKNSSNNIGEEDE